MSLWEVWREVDGNWVDIGSMLLAALYTALLWWRNRGSASFIQRETARNFVNGLALLPLLMLPASVLSSKMLTALVQSSRITLAVAGVVALIAVLEDDLN